jgi:hypothetical protein
MRSGDPKRREERVKLFATGLNNISVLTLGAGVISPLFLGEVRPVWAGSALAFGFVLHAAGQLVLEFVVKDEPRSE